MSITLEYKHLDNLRLWGVTTVTLSPEDVMELFKETGWWLQNYPKEPMELELDYDARA